MSALARCSSRVAAIFAWTTVSSAFGLAPAHYSPCPEQKSNDKLSHVQIVNADLCAPVIDKRIPIAWLLTRSSDGLALGRLI
jgi:hypothetical protein